MTKCCVTVILERQRAIDRTANDCHHGLGNSKAGENGWSQDYGRHPGKGRGGGGEREREMS